ncbi:serine-threonine kinase receptor-associated protein wmd [Arctopsyche grandis]|uniref:serine-threonine kinase receptor-associated protein wmd n=1 Tax=Arctopsyche grandis TaxID=121162 RepID=UPI00406D810E
MKACETSVCVTCDCDCSCGCDCDRPSVMSLRQISLNCSGHTRPVVHLHFSGSTACGYFLISACKDGNPMLRQGETGDWIGTFEGHKGAVWGVALDKPAARAATGAADFTAKLWDAVSGDIIHTFEHEHIVKSVNFSEADKYLVTASNEKLLRVFDLNRPENVLQTFSGHTSGIRHVSFFRNDSALVSAGDDNTVRVWDRNSGMEVQKIEFPSVPNSLEVSRDGTIVTIAHGSKVCFLNSNSLEKIAEVTVPTNCYSASLHPDKKVFVCGGEDLNVYKFDFATGEEIEFNKGHFGPVHCIRFSPDGELYASGSEDGTVRMWQTFVGRSYGLWRCSENGPQQAPNMELPATPNNTSDVVHVNGNGNYDEFVDS